MPDQKELTVKQCENFLVLGGMHGSERLRYAYSLGRIKDAVQYYLNEKDYADMKSCIVRAKTITGLRRKLKAAFGTRRISLYYENVVPFPPGLHKGNITVDDLAPKDFKWLTKINTKMSEEK